MNTAEEAATLPLFPLSSVLLPAGRLPLRVFEPRYIDMVSDCLKHDHGFGICQIRSGGEAGEPALPYGVGCEAQIIDWDQQPDGLLGITAEGQRKFRIRDISVKDDGLLVGEVAWLPPEPAEPVPEDCRVLVEVLRGILKQLEPIITYEQPDFDDARWVGGRLTELLPLAPRVRQYLVELDNPVARLIELRQALK